VVEGAIAQHIAVSSGIKEAREAINAARTELGYAPKVGMQEGLVRLAQYLTRNRMQQKT